VYGINDVVKDAAGDINLNGLFICNTYHTSTSDILTDTANWDLLIDQEALEVLVAAADADRVSSQANAGNAAASAADAATEEAKLDEYHIAFWWAYIGPSEETRVVMNRDITFAQAQPDAQYNVITNPTGGAFTISVYQDTTFRGTISISTGGVLTWALNADIVLSAGEYLRLVFNATTRDTAGLAITMVGTYT